MRQSTCESWIHWIQLSAGLAVSSVVAVKASLVFLGDHILRTLIRIFLCSIIIVSLLTSGHQILRFYGSMVGCSRDEDEPSPSLDTLVNYFLGVCITLMAQCLLLIIVFRAFAMRNHREYQYCLARNLTIRPELCLYMVLVACVWAFLAVLDVSELAMSLFLTTSSNLFFVALVLLASITESARKRISEAVNVAELAERKTEILINNRLLKLFWLPSLSLVLLSTFKLAFLTIEDLSFVGVDLTYVDIFLISSLIFLLRLCLLSALPHPRFRHLTRVNFVDEGTLPAGLGCVVGRSPVVGRTETRLTEGIAVTVESPEVPRAPLMSVSGRAHHSFYACLLENSWLTKMRAREEWTQEMNILAETLKKRGVFADKPQVSRVRPVEVSNPKPSFLEKESDIPATEYGGLRSMLVWARPWRDRNEGDRAAFRALHALLRDPTAISLLRAISTGSPHSAPGDIHSKDESAVNDDENADELLPTEKRDIATQLRRIIKDSMWRLGNSVLNTKEIVTRTKKIIVDLNFRREVLAKLNKATKSAFRALHCFTTDPVAVRLLCELSPGSIPPGDPNPFSGGKTRGKIAELEEENRKMRDIILLKRAQAASRDNNDTTMNGLRAQFVDSEAIRHAIAPKAPSFEKKRNSHLIPPIPSPCPPWMTRCMSAFIQKPKGENLRMPNEKINDVVLTSTPTPLNDAVSTFASSSSNQRPVYIITQLPGGTIASIDTGKKPKEEPNHIDSDSLTADVSKMNWKAQGQTISGRDASLLNPVSSFSFSANTTSSSIKKPIEDEEDDVYALVRTVKEILYNNGISQRDFGLHVLGLDAKSTYKVMLSTKEDWTPIDPYATMKNWMNDPNGVPKLMTKVHQILPSPPPRPPQSVRTLTHFISYEPSKKRANRPVTVNVVPTASEQRTTRVNSILQMTFSEKSSFIAKHPNSK